MYSLSEFISGNNNLNSFLVTERSGSKDKKIVHTYGDDDDVPNSKQSYNSVYERVLFLIIYHLQLVHQME